MKTTLTRIARLSPLAACIIAAPWTSAQDSFEAPRTSWGDPLLQGFYTNNTTVPMERPRDLGEQAFYSEQEFQERMAARAARAAAFETTPGTTGDVHYQIDDYGLSVDQNEQPPSLATSILTQPANGRMPPLLESARERAAELQALQTGGEYDSAQSRPLSERCMLWTHVGPPLRPVAYNTHVQIMQTQDHVVIMAEMIHNSRIIPLLDSRPEHMEPPQWMGNSWGRWEGDTLVVETTGFRDEVKQREAGLPYGPEGKIVERLTRTADDILTYEFTVSDPSLWESSWGGQYPMLLTTGPMFEFACHEGNYGIANTLSGAREEERRAAEGL